MSNNYKSAIFILIIIFFIIISACESKVIDLNDDPMPEELKDTEWVKATNTAHYGDLCLRGDYRKFISDGSKFISETHYDFMTEINEDAIIIKTYKATFNVEVFPKRMKAVLESITMNGEDVTGQEEIPIGAEGNTRDFEEAGESLYYVFENEYSDNGLDSLILASDDDLYPEYIAINQSCYTKIFDESTTLVPDDFAPATWKIATFRDRIKDTVFDEAFVEIKQRNITGTTDGSHMYVKLTYIFDSYPTEEYLYDFELSFISSSIIDIATAEATLQSVTKNGLDATGDDENTLANKDLPLPDTGDIISFIIDHKEDLIRYTDSETEFPPIAFDGTVYTLSDDI